MTLFSSNRLDRDHPYGLRRHRNFSSDRLYHYVIIADLVLRFSWLWRVVPGLAWLPETESGLFLLMFLEVARRWMWVFFRIEAEWSKFHLFHLSCNEPSARQICPAHHDSAFVVSFADPLSLCNSPEHPWSWPRRRSAWRLQPQVRRGLNRRYHAMPCERAIFTLSSFLRRFRSKQSHLNEYETEFHLYTPPQHPRWKQRMFPTSRFGCLPTSTNPIQLEQL